VVQEQAMAVPELVMAGLVTVVVEVEVVVEVTAVEVTAVEVTVAVTAANFYSHRRQL
jgi:hypothetical protein